MGGDQRLAAIDHFATIRFEGVRGVVELDPKEDLEEKICEPVQEQLDLWIIDHPAAFNKAAAKHAVVTFIELVPVAHDVTAVVGFISHHDDNGVAFDRREAAADGAPETIRSRVMNWRERGNSRLKTLENLPGAIRAAVVHHDNLVRYLAQPQLDVEMFHRSRDATFLVAGWDDHRKMRQSFLGGGIAHRTEESSSQSGFASACSAISSRIDCNLVVGRQPHVFAARRESITSHGTSKARGAGSGET